MLYIFELFIFLIVCFIYIHVYYHLKVSNSLEVYEIDECTKDRFEDICNLRQPFVGKNSIVEISNVCSTSQLDNIYSAFEVKIRNNTNYNSKTEDLYYPLKWRDAIELLKKDNEKKYICENNYEFLEETELLKDFQRNDSFLRPHMVSNCKYDIMKGSLNSHTPFRYELSFRTFFYALNGNITIKLCPPKNNKYLYEVNDYELFEFRSEINPWDVKKEYQNDFDKIKMLEVKLSKSEYIFIPAYWWYTIQYNTQDDLIAKFQYFTYMNNMALIPKYTMYLLQNQNIRHRFLGTRVEKNYEIPKIHVQENDDDDDDDNDENMQSNNDGFLNNNVPFTDNNVLFTDNNVSFSDNNASFLDNTSLNMETFQNSSINLQDISVQDTRLNNPIQEIESYDNAQDNSLASF